MRSLKRTVILSSAAWLQLKKRYFYYAILLLSGVCGGKKSVRPLTQMCHTHQVVTAGLQLHEN